ncbi:MAG: bifunctional (p)ppGpp synthetase/guanosine-3',5'-bis(diphosphate) 3'-pyrophosphohydrolase [Chitinispirillaceae bacterium]|nr:bifunctional (p)ppGpp synthetase/guanosine-3',5'-bis(diphosphate) 3'-pyrophosphohydrolase [Chitinispirillaceae bacterium]
MDPTLLLPTASLDEASASFIKRIKDIDPRVQTDLIERAFRFSFTAHRDQVRKSGEPFLSHLVAVAFILTEQKLDPVTIAAGLLHDVIEDTTVTHEGLAAEFGEEITLLVDGVTKIRTFQTKTMQERQAETYRKMLLSMAKDLRVIIIKFADRLHNLRTLKYLEPDRIQAIASETLDIYAPLAHRLGMAKIKWELEDLAFKHLYPDEYRELVAKVVASRNERETVIDGFTVPLRRRLDEEKIEATIVGRPKHFYSIYRKMVQRNKPVEEIFDLLAIRVIVKNIRDCYHALGVIHSLWTPLQERFKDYISTPKSNGYQSLHTTVFGEKGTIVEMQIRTWEMHQVAEDGIAAHWRYKSGGTEKMSSDDYALTWLKNVIEWQKDLTDSTEFFEFFKIDLFHAEIFVFTPKGDLISLPKGATVLDFAFAVHTHLGVHCMGAKVDGKIEPISKELKSGSTVEILHAASKKPSIDWLREVKTPKARSAIRRWLKTTGRQEGIELGKKIIQASYRRLHASTPFSELVPGLLQYLGISNLDRLYESVGSGEVSVNRVMNYFQVRTVRKNVHSSMVSRLVGSLTGRSQQVLVGGVDNLLVRFARCCNPIPGDQIVGFVTKGRGISVHRYDCVNAKHFSSDLERKIDVAWDEGEKKRYMVSIEVVGADRPGLLHETTRVFSDFGANVTDASMKAFSQQARGLFKIEIYNRNQLKQIIRRLQKIKGIENVSRVKEYIPSTEDIVPKDSSEPL